MRKVILVLSIFISTSMLGCLFPVMEQLPTHTPAPIQQIVVTPTPNPESEWFCLKGKVEIMSMEGSYGETSVTIIGEQLICGRDWKVSGIFGPVGILEDNPEKVITFGDLQTLRENMSGNKKD